MIYLIKSGCFSEVEIHGYFTNPEDAYAYCARQNNKGNTYAPYRVEAVRHLSVNASERPALIYTYERHFDSVGDPDGNARKWEMSYAPDDPEVFVFADRGPKPNTVSWQKIEPLAAFDYYMVRVSIATPDPEKASKIAQDTFYQVIAQKEGLSI